MPETAHEQWGSRQGFILATIGSAVGIGNIWRFSYVAGENGGGAFLLIYLVCVLLVGAPIILAELALGRHGQGDAVSAFHKIAPGSRWAIGGWVGVAVGFLILSFYSVVAGWALKFFQGAVTGALWRHTETGFDDFFANFIANNAEPVAWQFATIAGTMAVVACGVRRGIEIANRVLMPVLALIVIALAVFGATLPGAMKGWSFLLMPSMDAFLRPDVYIAALGQAFFSLGVGMAVFITYGGYLPRNAPLIPSAAMIIIGDTLFAIVAGLAIFPAVFAFGVSPTAGPELAFITLPKIFLALPGGEFVGAIFFFLLVTAALTSMVSMLEVPVAFVIGRFAVRRRSAVFMVGMASFALGIPSALSFGVLAHVQLDGRGIFDMVDQLVSGYMLPSGGILISLFVGWRWGIRPALEEVGLGGTRLGIIWIWLIRIVSPALAILIILGAMGDL